MSDVSEQARSQQLPIGYWLKRADEVLTARIDEAQRANGLTRLEWQALNVIRGRSRAMTDDIVSALQLFADAGTVGDVLRTMALRDYITGSLETGFELGPSGEELYEVALSTQAAVRQRAMDGISEAEYAGTVNVLRRLVENLERDDAARGAAG